MRNKTETIAILQPMRTETCKQMMTQERKLAGDRTKGKVDLSSELIQRKKFKKQTRSLHTCSGQKED